MVVHRYGRFITDGGAGIPARPFPVPRVRYRRLASDGGADTLPVHSRCSASVIAVWFGRSPASLPPHFRCSASVWRRLVSDGDTGIPACPSAVQRVRYRRLPSDCGAASPACACYVLLFVTVVCHRTVSPR